jgi:hypothetical protein
VGFTDIGTGVARHEQCKFTKATFIWRFNTLGAKLTALCAAASTLVNHGGSISVAQR